MVVVVVVVVVEVGSVVVMVVGVGVGVVVLSCRLLFLSFLLLLFHFPILFLNAYRNAHVSLFSAAGWKTNAQCACKCTQYNSRGRELKPVFVGGGRAKSIVGLPRCNRNSKIDFRNTSKVLTVKSQTETQFIAFEEHMADTADTCKLVCEARRIKMFSYLDFHSYFEGNGPNRFHFLCKILLPSKFIGKSIA